MLEAADPTTGEHSDDVELVVDEICRRLSVNGEVREDVLVAARLHDVGKVAIPREVLEKPGPLDDDEWALIKEHTLTGERILKAVPELVPASKLVRHSHEHYDGGGYPDALEGDQIPLGSRIILAADAFHAIRSDRPYRKGRPTKAALDEMKRCAGTQFDPEVVDALIASVRSSKRGRRGKIPVRLAVLFATLAIGSGGAFAAERGWIPSPIPGLGPEDSGGAPESASGVETTSATGEAAGGSGHGTASADDDVAGTEGTDGDTRGSGEELGNGRAARRDGDRGEASATGAGPAGENGQGGGNGAGAGAPQGGGGGSGGGSGDAGAAGGGSAGGSAGSAGATGGGPAGGGGSAGGGSVGGSPGSSGSAPGQTGSTPGQSGTTPGQTPGGTPGSGGAPPGQSGTAPGLSGSTPGQSGTAPGQSGAAPGNSGNAPGQGGPGGNPHG